jgi:hypothetical protein
MEKKRQILAFGASLTNGWNFGEKHPYAIRLQELIENQKPELYEVLPPLLALVLVSSLII